MVTIEWLTAALVLITAVYAYLTLRMAVSSERSVEAARDHIEATLRPYITIRPYVRSNTPFLYLAIVNSGASGANELRLQLDRDFYQFGERHKPEKNLRNASAFSNPIASFAPGQELHFALGPGWVLFGKESDPAVTPSEFMITATYRFGEKGVAEPHRIDLRPYIGSEENRDPVVEELEKIRNVLAQRAATQPGVLPGGLASKTSPSRQSPC